VFITPRPEYSVKMTEVMYGLVSEAKKNRFSSIPKLSEEGEKKRSKC
jgi:hypothetical protein